MSFISACSLARLAGRRLRIGNGLLQSRSYASSSVEPSKEAPKSQPAADSGAGANPVANISSRTHAPNNFEKRLLVFTKKYKSTDEVPALINQDVMERCRNQVRIKIANYMMLATAIGCIVMIMSGKRAQERGETVQKMNLDWHKEYNEKAKREAAAAAAPAKN
uniref:Protein with signal anchor n=1 Tax=Culex tarsalis TaxID=7177 RepID=A0A1Q3FGQ2_CULTA